MNILQHHLLDSPADGPRRGIYSVCSAHTLVIQAAAEQAKSDGSLLLIEATSNQVNQLGGYTGMRPADFRRLVEEIAVSSGLDATRLILGGDHLGPNPWKQLEPERAMVHALDMVGEYAAAGFSKIHLDASMACAGEDFPLTDPVVAERAAQLCHAVEQAVASANLPPPVYVIGTEVPTPGGATHSLHGLALTSTTAAQMTLDIHKAAFLKNGLEAAWERVLALVVQPGVEFDHDSVVDFDWSKAASLSNWLQQETSGIVFEAHSTDYQKPQAYKVLVQSGFAILKVGPALTFAMREALYALAAIENELLPSRAASRLPEILDEVMIADPTSWQSYYAGDLEEQRRLRVYSYSDRIRYYWNSPPVITAAAKLIHNLRQVSIPETMLSAYLPKQYERVREGTLTRDPQALVTDHVRDVLRTYAAAC